MELGGIEAVCRTKRTLLSHDSPPEEENITSIGYNVSQFL
jgi:hypothetical protein